MSHGRALRKQRRHLGLTRRVFVQELQRQSRAELTLTQDFVRDGETLTRAFIDGVPIAFARFADGESAIMFQHEIRAKRDGWRWRGQHDELLQPLLLAALQCDLPGWHIGIASESVHAAAHTELMAHVRVPLSRIAAAEVFHYANYHRYVCSLHIDDCLVIGHCCPTETPSRPNDPAWRDWPRFVDRMVEAQERAIVLCAGPWSNVLAHQYWLRSQGAPWRKPVFDFGAALAVRYRKRRLRLGQRRTQALATFLPSFNGKAT